jgi:hypothetical protein
MLSVGASPVVPATTSAEIPSPICQSQKRAKAPSSMSSPLKGVGSAEAYPVKVLSGTWFIADSDAIYLGVAVPQLRHIRPSLVWSISSSPEMRLLSVPIRRQDFLRIPIMVLHAAPPT